MLGPRRSVLSPSAAHPTCCAPYLLCALSAVCPIRCAHHLLCPPYAVQFGPTDPPPILSWLKDWRLRAALGSTAAADDLQLHLSLLAAGCLLRSGR